MLVVLGHVLELLLAKSAIKGTQCVGNLGFNCSATGRNDLSSMSRIESNRKALYVLLVLCADHLFLCAVALSRGHVAGRLLSRSYGNLDWSSQGRLNHF